MCQLLQHTFCHVQLSILHWSTCCELQLCRLWRNLDGVRDCVLDACWRRLNSVVVISWCWLEGSEKKHTLAVYAGCGHCKILYLACFIYFDAHGVQLSFCHTRHCTMIYGDGRGANFAHVTLTWDYYSKVQLNMLNSIALWPNYFGSPCIWSTLLESRRELQLRSGSSMRPSSIVFSVFLNQSRSCACIASCMPRYVYGDEHIAEQVLE